MAESLVDTWTSARELLRSMLKPDIYDLWFSSIEAEEVHEDSITLLVANEFCEVWLKDNYLSLIEDVLAHSARKKMKVNFRVAEHQGDASDRTSLSRPRHLEDNPSKASKTNVSSTRERDGAEPVFNPKYSFHSFVVGNNNNFAHAAAMAVAQNPGKSYNPLFLYGGVGLGKTHLLHAIGHEVTSTRKKAKVSYVSSEKFTNEYIAAIQENQLVKFRKKYRHTDVLLIDDIQFLAGKERIQEEFFHTFNALHEFHKQIVLTCDRPANEIRNLEQRLISRFEWGLVTDLQPPDIEVRMAILQKKADSIGVALHNEVMEFLANRIRTNVRRLEGALIRVASYAKLTGKDLTIEVVEGLLREVLQEEGKHAVTIDLIQKRVAEHYDIRLADMTSKRRPENIAFPRQVAMFLSRKLTHNSLNAIGEAFGGRDHGTVLHACRLVKDRMETDDNTRQVVNYLEKQLMR